MKLLLTTDFSNNSKGAIRFAQTLAKQSNTIEIVFYHALYFIKPTSWDDDFFEVYQLEEVKRLKSKLKKFALEIIGREKDNFVKIEFVVEFVLSIDTGIINFAKNNDIDFICIATQGAGLLRKIMGTNTSFIVNNSQTPVLAIPSNYRSTTLSNAVYLSDFENVEFEINKIATFSDSIKINLEVLHYSSIVTNIDKFNQNKEIFNKDEYKSVKLNIINDKFEETLINRVSEFITENKPELLIMFTKQKKGFFEWLFIPSKSAELTYTTKIPVLIFSK